MSQATTRSTATRPTTCREAGPEVGRSGQNKDIGTLRTLYLRNAETGAAEAPALPVVDHLSATPGTVPPSVCLYTPSANPSGMGRHMLDLAASYAERGGTVTLMAWPTEHGISLLEQAREVGATAVAIPHPRDPEFATAITAHLRRHPVEVFHVHAGTGRENFDGARAARAASVRAVVQTLHQPWMISSRHKRKPFFEAIGAVDHLIAVSHAQGETYLRIGVPPDRLTTVPNGVRPCRVTRGRAGARRELGLGPDQPVVMTVGRLAAMKGQRYLVECLPQLLAEFPELAVVVLGSGDLHDALRARAQAVGVSHALHLVGHRADARALLDAADVFTLPSLHEGMPLAAMEAMDAGLPVIGTSVIGTAEVIDPGVTGELVPPRDARALGESIATLLRDPTRRAALSAAGRRRFVEHFTATLMATRTIGVYEAVLATAGSGSTAGLVPAEAAWRR